MCCMQLMRWWHGCLRSSKWRLQSVFWLVCNCVALVPCKEAATVFALAENMLWTEKLFSKSTPVLLLLSFALSLLCHCYPAGAVLPDCHRQRARGPQVQQLPALDSHHAGACSSQPGELTRPDHPCQCVLFVLGTSVHVAKNFVRS
jgi:hypothetical protein